MITDYWLVIEIASLASKRSIEKLKSNFYNEMCNALIDIFDVESVQTK